MRPREDPKSALYLQLSFPVLYSHTLNNSVCRLRISATVITLFRYVVGFLLVLLGVFIARQPLLTLSVLSDPLNSLLVSISSLKAFTKVPQTLPLGVACSLLGVMFLLPKSRHHRYFQDELLDSRFNVNLYHGLCFLLIAILSLAGCYYLESLKLLTTPLVSWCFLAILVLVVLATLMVDYGRGRIPRLGISLKECGALAIASLFLFAYYVRGLDSWKFLFIGDEYGFFWYAQLLLSRDPSETAPLEASGCFEFFPMITSWWQALFLRAFGETNWAWRASMGAITALSLPACYVLFKQVCSNLGSRAWIAASAGIIALYLSEFVIIWAKIGKPHAVFLTPVIVAAAFMMLAIRQGSLCMLVMSGISAGLGVFLSSLGPVIALGTIGILLVVWRAALCLRFRDQIAHELIIPGLIVISCFLVASAPILAQLDYWRNMLFVNLNSPEAQGNLPLFIPKLVAAIFLPWDFVTSAHFLWDNPVDPLTATLCIAGLASITRIGWQPALAGILIHGMIAYLAGAKSQYEYPPPTRMQLDMLPVALMVALGFSLFQWKSATKAGIALTTMCAWTLVYSTVKIEEHNPYQDRPNIYASFMKSLQEYPDSNKTFVLVLLDEMYDQTYLFENFNKTFQRKFSLVFLRRTENLLAEINAQEQASPGHVVVLLPEMFQDLQSSIESSSNAVDVRIVAVRHIAPRDPTSGGLIARVFLPIIQFFERVRRPS